MERELSRNTGAWNLQYKPLIAPQRRLVFPLGLIINTLVNSYCQLYASLWHR